MSAGPIAIDELNRVLLDREERRPGQLQELCDMAIDQCIAIVEMVQNDLDVSRQHTSDVHAKALQVVTRQLEQARAVLDVAMTKARPESRQKSD